MCVVVVCVGCGVGWGGVWWGGGGEGEGGGGEADGGGERERGEKRRRRREWSIKNEKNYLENTEAAHVGSLPRGKWQLPLGKKVGQC